jgi:hypothetical protein
MRVIISGEVYFQIAVYIECWLITAIIRIIETVPAVKDSRVRQ